MALHRINVAFRFDDPSAKSNWSLEKEILGAFRDGQIPLTVGVVPVAGFMGTPVSVALQTPAHLVAASREGWLEIAQHGLNHSVQTTCTAGKPSDFRGLEAAEQDRRVREGRDVLQEVFGQPLHGFVPPFNSFDEATVAAVRRAGFGYLSGGYEYGSTSDGDELAIIPQTTSIVSVRSAIERARRVQFFERTVVAVLHHYDFAESGSDRRRTDLTSLQELLAWLSRQEDVYPMTMARLMRRASSRSWALAARLLRARDRLPRRLRTLVPAGFLIHRAAG
jgi:peptidoglycan/xylan/chitin deacetylase (PgdA/CDA1 family)